MKTTAKRTGAVVAAAAYGVTLFAGLGFVFGSGEAAHAASNEGPTYYYSGLKHNPRAEKFYKAFEALEEDGSLKKNEVDYDLVANGTTVSEDVRAYVEEGSAKLPVAFGAGRDAFFLDNPDVFYADVFGVSVSAGTQGENYAAFLDTSRTDSLYIGCLDSEGKIDAAIKEYNDKINEITAGAKAAGDTLAQIKYVNKYIIDNTEYSFGTRIEDGYNVDTDAAGYVHTSYGALVYGEAVCEGYAKAFKAVLDRLSIPCVCIAGNSKNSKGVTVAHMWNAVQLEGQWYAVDVTWNDTSEKAEKYMLLGDIELSKDHVVDNVVSSSGYELKAPALKPYNYGSDEDANGMGIKGEYKDSSDGTGKICTLTVSYEGKGAKKLEQENKYLTARIGFANENGEIVWQDWTNFIYAADFMFPGSFRYDDKNSYVNLTAGIQYVQFALVDYAPDDSKGAIYPENPNYYPDYYTPEQIKELAGKPCYYTYLSENLTENHFLVQPSVPYQNEGYGTYIPAPSATGVTPHNGGDLDVNGTYEMKFVYNDTLELAENKTAADVAMHVTSSRNDSTLRDNIEITNFKWDGDKTVTFTFKPSKMYEHNLATYYFTPTNLVGKKSSKTPEPVRYSFKGKSVVCSKVFNDGRLYMSVYGQPQMLDTSDLSLDGFKDDEGNYFAAKQRSQLLLVADRPSKIKENSMKDKLADEMNVEQDDIVTTATYEIDLQICGMVRNIPNGSYMQVAFGFPEGFSPDDAGTTFKIYHYTHDDKGNITGVEEIPVIITEYGLIAKVKSFSPFMIVQVKKDAVAESTAKSVYASVSGLGGALRAEDGKSGISEVTGDSVTYTAVAETGFKLDRILLNGKALPKDRYANGSVTLTKEELSAGNTLEASFVTEESAVRYQAKGIEIKQPDTIVVSASDIAGDFVGPESQTNVAAIVIASVVLAAVIGTGIFAIVYVAKK